MANAQEIREQLEKLLSSSISLDEFENWFAPYSWNIHKHGDEETQRLAYAIEHQLSQYEQDCDELRIELTRITGSEHAESRYGSPSPVLVAQSNGPSEFAQAKIKHAA